MPGVSVDKVANGEYKSSSLPLSLNSYYTPEIQRNQRKQLTSPTVFYLYHLLPERLFNNYIKPVKHLRTPTSNEGLTLVRDF
jgi:hypothetical protein